jgi:AcrR family transcriptional regulator
MPRPTATASWTSPGTSSARAASLRPRRRWPAWPPVGIGTVFRHFPTKAALLEAVLVRRFDHLARHAEELLGAADPGEAFLGLFSHLAAHAAAKITITESLLDAGGSRDGDAARASERLRRAVGALFQKAQQAGVVRDDVELPEVYALLVGASRAAARAGLDQEAQARLFSIVFDGLAPGQRAARDIRTGTPQADRRECREWPTT